MPPLVVMMLYYAAGSIFSSLPVTTIQGFSSIEACRAAVPQVQRDFTRKPYGENGEVLVPITKCFSYAEF